MPFTSVCNALYLEMIYMKSIRAKIFALVLLPLILVVLVLTTISVNGIVSLGETEIALFKEQLISSKKDELKNYIQIATKSVKHLSGKSENDHERMREIIRNQTFARSGYFFVYHKDGTNIVHGSNTTLEGRNLANVKDTRGTYLVKEMIDAAIRGGGFVEYYWENPATQKEGLKLSYTGLLDQWDYMIGIGVYIDDIDSTVANMQAKTDQKIESVFFDALIASALIILCCIVIVCVVAPKITKPLLFVAESLEQIAAGDGDLTQRIDVNSKDEAGRVALAFNQFVEMIQGLVFEIRESSSQLSEGMSQLEKLREKSTQRLNVQTSYRNKIVDGIDTLLNSATNISDSSAQATEQAKGATLEAEQGIEGLHKNNTQIKQLADDIQKASSVISELEHEVAGIGTVLNVIQDIAEQTNLLALNAAIEAARAGDQGRGFAVVADEVRALAARTRNSTEEIHDMIQRLEGRSQSAVTVMNESQKRSFDTAKHADTVIERLAHLNTMIDNINAINSSIEETSGDQSEMTSQMSEGIAHISKLGDESMEDDKESINHAQHVVSQTKHLFELVSKFKV